MVRYTSIILAALLASAAPAGAATTDGPPFLAPVQYDSALLLPPPPAPDSPLAKAEIAELERIQKERTKAEFAAAAQDSHTETLMMFAPVLGADFDLEKLPATAKLSADLAKTEDVVTKGGKAFFKRSRPYIVDPKLVICEPPKPAPAQNSYPSGHSTVAFIMGVVMASIVPDKAQAILARSKAFAENRLVCGVHFRSDIVAGEALGTVVGSELLQSAAFKPEYDAAVAELRRAGIAK
jgi:hypothetical protein